MAKHRSYRWLIGWIAIMGCAVAASCTGAASSSHPVVARVDPATPVECPLGGAIVRAGIDRNDNGTLDDGEVITETARCAGRDTPPNSPPLLVRIVAEPAGTQCAAGGDAVHSGLDNNRNGQLDDAEVTHTDYVCSDAALLTRR